MKRKTTSSPTSISASTRPKAPAPAKPAGGKAKKARDNEVPTRPAKAARPSSTKTPAKTPAKTATKSAARPGKKADAAAAAPQKARPSNKAGRDERPSIAEPVINATKVVPIIETRDNTPMKVLFVASEIAPFRKTGGLADVAGVLPRALRQRGIDVRVVMPLYQGMRWDQLDRLEGTISVPMYFGAGRAGVRLGRLPGSDVPVYFIEYNRFYDRPHLYGPPGQAYPDNLERFSFLSRASLELAKTIGFIPDIIHANDWQTALVPVYVNTVEWGKPLHGCGTVFTIHNLAYQGNFERGAMFITGLGNEHFHSGEFEHFGDLNLMKAAVRHTNILTTVSPNYAHEIQTSAYGFGLDGELHMRSADLRGVLNGIDVHEWDPATDPHIAAHFDREHMAGKAACKAALQKQMGLPVRPDVPLFGIVGRLTSQKGYDVLAYALERILSWDLQLILLGNGDSEAEHFFSHVAGRRGDRFRTFIGFHEGLAHQIEAGSDFFLMPSRFEPCGLNQMYSQRYGTLPIVRGTGGLLDTVANYDQATGTGTGFIFWDLTPNAVADSVGWALSTYFDRPEHIVKMRHQAMGQDFSWERAAEAYEGIYREAYLRRRGHPFRP